MNFCPKCREDGTPSRVYPSPLVLSTSMYCQPFFDEMGIYHTHDGNHHTRSFRCSEEHRWTVTTKRKCPNCEFGAGDPVIRQL